MNKVKRSLDNQAIGLVPLLLFMFLDNYFSYLLSFIIGVTFCFVCIFLFQILSKDKVYQFLLLPAATTLVLYSIFLCLRLEPVLYLFSVDNRSVVGCGIGVFGVCQADNIAADPDFSASDLQADIDAYYVK